MAALFQLTEEEMETGACVYKLFYGDRYVIVKGKSLASSIFFIDKGYAQFLAGGKLATAGEGHKQWDGKNSYYFKFYTWLKRNPGLKMSIQILCEKEEREGFLLLKAEEIALQVHMRDRKCLNSNVTAYIPKLRSNGHYGWISDMDVMRFKMYQQSSPVIKSERV